MSELVLAFLTSFGVSLLIIPRLIRFAEKYGLFDRPDARKSHIEVIPTLGGIAIVAGVVLSIIIWTPYTAFGDIQYILGALIILFLVGAKDDLDPVSPWIKLAAQILSAMILAHLAGIRLTSLYGILGIWDLSYGMSLALSAFTILVITNSFNLIDGIDGLLGCISIVILGTFGYWFYRVEEIELAIMSASLIGAIIAFLKFNWTPARIFMGDTGSLFIGVICAIQAIEFIEINHGLAASPLKIDGVPTVAAGILLLPLLDTLRVFIYRILQGKSPLHPDQNHIHHILVQSGLSHRQTAILLSLVSLLLSVVFIVLHQLGARSLLYILIAISVCITVLLHLLARRSKTTSP